MAQRCTEQIRQTYLLLQLQQLVEHALWRPMDRTGEVVHGILALHADEAVMLAPV